MDGQEILSAYNGLRHRIRDLENQYHVLNKAIYELTKQVYALKKPLKDPARVRTTN